MIERLRRWVRAVILRIRLRVRAIRNYQRGLAFSAVARCRECDHTTPAHYPTCRRRWR